MFQVLQKSSEWVLRQDSESQGQRFVVEDPPPISTEPTNLVIILSYSALKSHFNDRSSNASSPFFFFIERRILMITYFRDFLSP